MNRIKSENIEVLISDDMIHIDDTVHIIKNKIILFLMNSEKYSENLSREEIYLVTKKEKFVDIKELFNLLSVDRNSISKDKLLLYLSNIDGIDIDAIEDRDSYTYNDLFFMKSKKYKINIPLGTYLNKDKHFFVSNIQKIGNDKIKGILNKTLIKKKLIDSIKYNDTFILYDNFNSENPIVDNAIYI